MTLRYSFAIWLVTIVTACGGGKDPVTAATAPGPTSAVSPAPVIAPAPSASAPTTVASSPDAGSGSLPVLPAPTPAVTTSANVLPVALNRRISTRAEEGVSVTLKGAVVDTSLSYAISTPPKNGVLSGTGNVRIYTPNTGFRGTDTFAYTATNAAGASEPATVTVLVVDDVCTSDQFDGSTQGLQLHVANQLANKDISSSRSPVTVAATAAPVTDAWTARTDLTSKVLSAALAKSLAARTISFRFTPSAGSQSSLLVQTSTLRIEQAGSVIKTTYAAGGQSYVLTASGSFKTTSCNHFALVFDGGSVTAYLNGLAAASAASQVPTLSGSVQMGSFAGKLWDLRVYDRSLSNDEITTLAADCADTPVKTSPYSGYDNYLCGVYVCEWWPAGTNVADASYRYYLYAQDRVWEHNVLDARMHPTQKLCDFHAKRRGRDLQLSDAIRSTFVSPWSFASPLGQPNAGFWMHENFHSFQNQVMSYSSLSGSRWILEATATWGADHSYEAASDWILGYYTLMPHLALFARTEDMTADMIGGTFIGGHMYGSQIWYVYLTRYVMEDPKLIGDLFNDPRIGGVGAIAAQADLLAQNGADIRQAFADFAARVTTWDLRYAELYKASEQTSLVEMKKEAANIPGGVYDAKITRQFTSDGSGSDWQTVPHGYEPGAWAFNAYRTDVTTSGTYEVALSPASSNSAYAEFQGRVVVHDEASGSRTYYSLPAATSKAPATLSVPAAAGQKLYLIVASTPLGLPTSYTPAWSELYSYQYRITRK